MNNAKEITNFSNQRFKLYISNEVNNELNNKISLNFSSNNNVQRERAEVLFRHTNRALYNIANGIMIDETNVSRDGELYYDIFEGIGTILFVPIINDQKELGMLVTRIIWKYQTNDWWKIVESKTYTHILNEVIRKYISENCEIIK